MARQADADVEKLIKKIDEDFQTARRNFRCWARGSEGRSTLGKVALTAEVQAERRAAEIVRQNMATIEAAGLVMQRALLRPASDLVELLTREISRLLAADDAMEFASALGHAKRTIGADIFARIR